MTKDRAQNYKKDVKEIIKKSKSLSPSLIGIDTFM